MIFVCLSELIEERVRTTDLKFGMHVESVLTKERDLCARVPAPLFRNSRARACAFVLEQHRSRLRSYLRLLLPSITSIKFLIFNYHYCERSERSERSEDLITCIWGVPL